MKKVFVDGVETKGCFSLNGFFRLPVSKRVSVAWPTYIVGYYVGSSFKHIHSCDSEKNAFELALALSKDVSYQVCVFSVDFKLKRLL